MTRFVAIGRLPYDTWRMRSILTVLLAAAVFLPAAASASSYIEGIDAFDIEETLRAQHVQYQGGADYRVSQDGMSLSQAIQSVRNSTGGKVISAETKVQGGREVHHIKVLKDGKVRVHRVNGRKRR